MIVRIVKMTFIPDRVADFLNIFNESKDKIRASEGCTHLELFKDINTPNVLFTYSYWETEEHLNNYRNSDLFKTTWKKTKLLFAGKAEACSLRREY